LPAVNRERITAAAAGDPKYIELLHVATGKVLAVDVQGLRVVVGKDGKGLGRQRAPEKDGDY
jgi:hypothetical protein